MKKFFIVIFSLLLIPNVSLAQTSRSLEVAGLGVDPFLIEANIEEGKTVEQTITLTNTTSGDLPLSFSIQDFNAVNKAGEPQFLPVGQESNPRYSIVNWIKVEQQPNFIIPAKQSTKVKISITAPPSAEPGSHWGGLLFSFVLPSPANHNVLVNQKLAVLIFAKLGVGNEKGTIGEFLTHYDGTLNNTLLRVQFVNQGNVHLRPKGQVEIYNIFGKHIASIPINPDANIVVPEAARVFENNWTPPSLPMYYTAKLTMWYGNPKLEVTATSHIAVFPLVSVIFWGGLLLALIVALYAVMRRYNLWLLKKHVPKE